MQEIARETYIQEWTDCPEPRESIWFYNPEDERIYRDYGDGKGVVPEMSYSHLRAAAQTVRELKRVKMRCTRQLIKFVINKESKNGGN